MLSKLRISHRLIGIVAVSLVLYVVAAGIGWMGMGAASSSLRSVYEDRAVPMQMLGEIDARMREDALNILFAFEDAPGRPAAGLLGGALNTLTAAVKKNAAQFDANWQRYMSTSHTADEAKLAADFADKHKLWRARLEETTQDVEARKLNNPEVLSNFLYAVREERQQALDALHLLIAYQAQVAREEYEAAEQRTAASRVILLLLFLLGGGLILAISVLTLRHLSSSLREAGDAAAAIAAGNLARPVKVSGGDEIGELLGKLAAMRSKLHELIGAIHGNVRTLSQQAEQLSQAAAGSAQAIDSQSKAAASMATAVEELSASIDQVGGNAREAHHVSQTSSQQAVEGGRIIHQTATEMEHVAAAVNTTAGTIRALEDYSGQISGIVQVIKEISDQTNLLALNAAIEAARAGEQGRGFAVVADEVRKLAERTNASTLEIGQMITKIQEGTQQAVREMEAGVSRVTDGVTLAHQVGDSVSTIRDSAERAAQVVEAISQTLDTQTRSAREVAHKVETIAQATEENSSTVQQTAALAQQLAQSSNRLAELAGRFRIQ